MASESDPFAGLERVLRDSPLGSRSGSGVLPDVPSQKERSPETEGEKGILSATREFIRFLYEEFFPSGKRQKAEREQQEEEERQARERLYEFRSYLHNLGMLRSGERFDAAQDLLSFLQREYPEQESELRHEALGLHKDRLNSERRTLDRELKESMIRICDERDKVGLVALKRHVEQMLETLSPQIVAMEKEHDGLAAYDIHMKQLSKKIELEIRVRIAKDLQEFWEKMLGKVYSLEKYLAQPPNEVLRSRLHSEIWLH